MENSLKNAEYSLENEEFNKKIEFTQKLSTYLHRWQNTETIDSGNEQVIQLHKEVLLEQILKVVIPEMAIQLREKQPESMEKIVLIFENYRISRDLQAHKLFKTEYSEIKTKTHHTTIQEQDTEQTKSRQPNNRTQNRQKPSSSYDKQSQDQYKKNGTEHPNLLETLLLSDFLCSHVTKRWIFF